MVIRSAVRWVNDCGLGASAVVGWDKGLYSRQVMPKNSVSVENILKIHREAPAASPILLDVGLRVELVI